MGANAPSKKKLGRFRLSFKGRSVTFTSFGVRTVVACLLVGGAAINTGSNLLYLCTAMLLSMVIVSGILSEQTLKMLRVSRTLPDEIYAGSPFTVRYEVKNNKKRIPSFALSITGRYEAGGAGGDMKDGPGAFVLSAPPSGMAAAAADELAHRRGRLRLLGYDISTAFPFGMFEKTLSVTADEDRLVFPRPKPIGRDLRRELAGGMGDTPVSRRGAGADIRSLRQYASSDDARHIHWKSSANLAELMTKEYEAEQDRTVTVLLDNSMPGAGTDRDARFEEAVSLAASATRTLIMEYGLPVRLATRDSVGPTGTGRGFYIGLMEELALIGPSQSREMDGRLSGLFESGPSVLILPGPGSGWSSQRQAASVTLEAGA